jgi:hypothetical protein
MDIMDEEMTVVEPRRGGRPRKPENEDPYHVVDDILAVYDKVADKESMTCSIGRKNPKTGKFATVGQFENLGKDNLPTPDFVGKNYGAGEFCVFVRFRDENNKPQMRRIDFELGEEYNRYVKNETVSQNGQDPAVFGALVELAKAGGQKDDGKSMELFMSMQQESSKMMAMMFSQMQQQAQNTMQMMMAMMQAQSQASQNMVTALLQGNNAQKETFGEKMFMTLMPKMLEKNEQKDPYGEIGKILSLSKELQGDPKEEKEESTANKIVDAVITFLPQLVNNTINAITVRQIITAYPEYQQLQENPALQEQVRTALEAKLTPDQLGAVADKTGMGFLNIVHDKSEEEAETRHSQGEVRI